MVGTIVDTNKVDTIKQTLYYYDAPIPAREWIKKVKNHQKFLTTPRNRASVYILID